MEIRTRREGGDIRVYEILNAAQTARVIGCGPQKVGERIKQENIETSTTRESYIFREVV